MIAAMTAEAPAPQAFAPARTREAYEATVRAPFDPLGMARMQMPLTAEDIVIATFPKCGTTWMQQICHGLRSNGDMDFKEVSWPVPWIERGHMFGIDADRPQGFTPRAFKTHLEYANVNKGARYIHVLRDPKDVLVSFYRFMSNGVIDPQHLSIETFADVWLFSDQLAERTDPDAPFGPNLYNYWRHLLDWWGARQQVPVLTLAYEHMRADLRSHVARIATFMGIAASDALIDLATRQASFEFMEAHKEQFTDHLHLPGRQIRLEKVVKGEVGGHRAMVSAELGARIDAAWRHYVTPVLGVASYDAFIARLA